MAAKKRTPQQKKRLSLQRDRRNDYGESNKSARTTIRRRKAKQKRGVRHAARQILQAQEPESADANVRGLRRGAWKNTPDVPLGEFIEGKRAKRSRLAGRKRRRI